MNISNEVIDAYTGLIPEPASDEHYIIVACLHRDGKTKEYDKQRRIVGKDYDFYKHIYYRKKTDSYNNFIKEVIYEISKPTIFQANAKYYKMNLGLATGDVNTLQLTKTRIVKGTADVTLFDDEKASSEFTIHGESENKMRQFKSIINEKEEMKRELNKLSLYSPAERKAMREEEKSLNKRLNIKNKD